METKFYMFDQNNSGGSFDVDENVCHRVIIEAKTENEAIALFEPMIENQRDSCPCCGDRWYISPEEINIDKYKEKGYPSFIYTHYKDYQQRWFTLYDKFKRKEEPSLIKNRFEKFGTNIFFETIEEYCQYLSNAHGWTYPDIRIHYANGEKLEIFITKID